MKSLFYNFRRLRFTSKLFLLLGVIFLLPLFMLIPYGETEYTLSFVVPAFLTMSICFIMEWRQRQSVKRKKLCRQRHTVMVVAIWIFAFVMGGLPFFISGQLDPLRSIFESTSGWTATGMTMLDVTKTPYIFLFYRSLMQLLGGIGFVLLMLMFASGTEAMELFSAEGHPDKLEPNLIDTARFMMAIYIGFTAVGVLLYMICGMPWFDAICHSMAALATGGFSTQPDSIAHYNSVAIEAVTIVLMLLGGTNFAILSLLIKGKWKKLSKIGEMHFLIVLLIIFIPLFAFLGVNSVYRSFGESLRISVFQTVTALTSTGFTITSFNNWHPGMIMSIIMLMLIGGGAGSTAGGIKYSRVYILYKSFIFRLRERFLPERSVQNLTVYSSNGKTTITSKRLLQIHHFTLVYIATFFVGSLLLTFTGMPLDTAMFEFSSSLGTIGLSTGATSVESGSFVLIVQIFGMLLARLEVYVVYVFFAAGIRKTVNVLGRT